MAGVVDDLFGISTHASLLRIPSRGREWGEAGAAL